MNTDTTLLQVSPRGAGCLLWYQYPHGGEIFWKGRTNTQLIPTQLSCFSKY